MFRSVQAEWARLMTSSLCDAPWKCDRACMLELNSRLQTSHRGFTGFTERLLVFLAAAAEHAVTCADVAISESVMKWLCWLNEQFSSNDWNTANKSPCNQSVLHFVFTANWVTQWKVIQPVGYLMTFSTRLRAIDSSIYHTSWHTNKMYNISGNQVTEVTVIGWHYTDNHFRHTVLQNQIQGLFDKDSRTDKSPVK